jgi:hypothetical protein
MSAAGAAWAVYMYAVAGARFARKGNVGPVLIDISKSKTEPGYMGAQLNDPEENWVYLSPMSWHSSGTKAMWPEMLREKPQEKRLRIVELKNYKPSPSVPASKTPESITFASDKALDDWLKPTEDSNAKIAGKRSGFIEVVRQKGASRTSYTHFSDDGKAFFDGYEKVYVTEAHETVF